MNQYMMSMPPPFMAVSVPQPVQYGAAMNQVRRERHLRPRNLGPWIPPGMEAQAPYIASQTAFETAALREAHDRETCRREYGIQRDEGPNTTVEMSVNGTTSNELIGFALNKPLTVSAADPTLCDYDGKQGAVAEMRPQQVAALEATRQAEVGKQDPHTVFALALRALPIVIPTSQITITGTQAYEQCRLVEIFAGRVSEIRFDDVAQEARVLLVRGTKVYIGRIDQTQPQDIFIMVRHEDLHTKDGEEERWENLRARVFLAINCSNPLAEEASQISEWETLSVEAEQEAIVTVKQPQTPTNLLGCCDACEFVRQGISAATIIGRQVYGWWERVHPPGRCRTLLSRTRWGPVPTRIARVEIPAYPLEPGKIPSWSIRPHRTDEEAMMALYVTASMRVVEIEWEGRDELCQIGGAQLYMMPDKWYIVATGLRGRGLQNFERALRDLG